MYYDTMPSGLHQPGNMQGKGYRTASKEGPQNIRPMVRPFPSRSSLNVTGTDNAEYLDEGLSHDQMVP